MAIRTTKSSVKRFHQAEVAKQLVNTWRTHPTILQNTAAPHVRMMKQLADDLMLNQHTPKYLAEWIAVSLFYYHHPRYQALRTAARVRSQAGYLQAKQWIDIIDRQRQPDA